MPTTGSSSWYGEQLELAEKMILEGATAAEVGCAVGKSKNAVIGMAHRRGWKFSRNNGYYVSPAPRPDPAPKKKKIVVKQAAPSRIASGLFSSKKRLLKKSAPPPPVRSTSGLMTPDLTKAVSLMDVRSDHCKYILDTGMYCGNPREEPTSWCPYHRAMCTEPRKPGRNRPWSRVSSRAPGPFA